MTRKFIVVACVCAFISLNIIGCSYPPASSQDAFTATPLYKNDVSVGVK